MFPRCEICDATNSTVTRRTKLHPPEYLCKGCYEAVTDAMQWDDDEYENEDRAYSSDLDVNEFLEE